MLFIVRLYNMITLLIAPFWEYVFAVLAGGVLGALCEFFGYIAVQQALCLPWQGFLLGAIVGLLAGGIWGLYE